MQEARSELNDHFSDGPRFSSTELPPPTPTCVCEAPTENKQQMGDRNVNDDDDEHGSSSILQVAITALVIESFVLIAVAIGLLLGHYRQRHASLSSIYQRARDQDEYGMAGKFLQEETL